MLIALAIAVTMVIVAIAPFIALTPRAPNAPTGDVSVEGLERYLTDLTANETPPALEVVVMKDGAVKYSKAFGLADGPTGRRATVDGVYHFWSVTKLFTATAIMQLAEDGKIALDDPVAKYVPEFQTTLGSGAKTDITVRQLLDHSSGMKNLGPVDLVGWIHRASDLPVDQTLLVNSRMRSYRSLKNEPGRVSAYSNAGYIVLGAIIEAASRGKFEDFVRQRILRPLQMGSTDFVYRDDLQSRAVTGSHPLFHYFTPLLLFIHHDWFTHWVASLRRSRMWLVMLNTDYTGPTGLIGTGRDLARFGQAFLNGGELDGQRILKSESVDMMLNAGFGGNSGPDGDRMGLGWHWWNNAAIPFKGHGGDGPGFSAQLAIIADLKMVVVVLGNDTLCDRVGLTNLIAAVFK